MSAQKFTNELASKLLDLIAEDADISEAARACGISTKLVYVWANKAMKAKAAQDETSQYRIKNWLKAPEDTEDSFLYFSDALNAARKMHTLSVESISRRLLRGRERPVLDKSGRQVWLEDAHLIAQYNGDREAALADGIFDPFFQHCPLTMDRLPMVVVDDPPAAFRVAALKALMPGIWNVPEHRIQETHVNINAQANAAIKQIEPRPTEKSRPQTPLVEEMERMLADLRANGPKHPRPEGSVQKFSPDGDHQQDDQDNRPPSPPNPRAYREPKLNPPNPKRPNPPGWVAPGGMKVV